MRKSNLSIKEVEQAIRSLKIKDQRRLLKDLPKVLKISASDLGLLKVAESSFGFWDNPEDEVYDKL
jgi:hypothetical protein